MGKGGYSGGSTIIGPRNAGWFTKAGRRPIEPHERTKPLSKEARAAKLAEEAMEKALRRGIKSCVPANMKGVKTRKKAKASNTKSETATGYKVSSISASQEQIFAATSLILPSEASAGQPRRMNVRGVCAPEKRDRVHRPILKISIRDRT